MYAFYEYYVMPLQDSYQKVKKPQKAWPKVKGFLTKDEDFRLDIITAKLSDRRVFFFTPGAQTMPSLSLFQIKRTSLNATFSMPLFNKFNVEVITRFIPILTLTTPVILSAAGVDAKFRYSSIAQILFAQTLRRSLILMRNFRHNLLLKGSIPGFGPLWRRVNSANNEYYLDFYTNSWVYDISVINLKPGVERDFAFQVKNALSTASTLAEDGQTPEPLLTAVEKNSQFFLVQNAKTPNVKRLYRYSFEWAAFLVVLKNPHGFIKAKKVRSIKKRLVKKMVSTAQRRLWVI